MIRLLAKSLHLIQRDGRPCIPGGTLSRDDGQVTARVLPQSLYDRLMLPGTTAEVWMEPGVSVQDTLDGQAAFYHDFDGKGEGSPCARRRQRIDARPFGCSTQTVRRRECRSPQIQPGQRLLGSGVREGFPGPDQERVPASGLRWRLGGRVSLSSPSGRRTAHHRVRQDLRGDRVWVG